MFSDHLNHWQKQWLSDKMNERHLYRPRAMYRPTRAMEKLLRKERKMQMDSKQVFDKAKSELESHQFHYWLCFCYGLLTHKMDKRDIKFMNEQIAKIRKEGKNDMPNLRKISE